MISYFIVLTTISKEIMICVKYLVLLNLLCCGIALKPPVEFQICKRSSPNLNECLKEAIQNAMPVVEKGLSKYKLQASNPLKIASANIAAGTNAVQVEQKFTDLKIYGTFQATVESVEANITDTTMDLVINAFVPKVYGESNYDFNGNILVVPIVGNGTSLISIDNNKLRVTMSAGVNNDTQKSIDLTKFKFYTEPQKVTYNLTNLFNGDDELGAEMNKLLNEKWKEIWDDIQGAYMNTVEVAVSQVLKLFFAQISFDELFPL